MAQGPTRRQTLQRSGVALLVFVSATAALYGPALWQGPSEVVPYSSALLGARSFAAADIRMVAYTISRNAQVLVSQPWEIFDADPCYPAERALALGEPMLAHGLLAVPAWILSGDPLVAFNGSIVLGALIACFAMYWLVRDWTGNEAAAIAAGLIYATTHSVVANVAHPYVQDTSWTVLALFFARRYFAGGRARDVLAAAGLSVMQLATSVYPSLAAALVAVPMLAWLSWAYGAKALRPAPVLGAAAIVLAGAALLYGPFLTLRANQEIHIRGMQTFVRWIGLWPSLWGSPSWLQVGLAVGGLVWGRRVIGALGGDPRIALVAASALTALVAADGNAWGRAAAALAGDALPPPLPPLYSWLAAALPGLDAIRAPANVIAGTHLVISILAGIGAATLLATLDERWRRPASIALVATVFVATLGPAVGGLDAGAHLVGLPVRPPLTDLRFHRELAARGNHGPLLELPVSVRESPRGLNAPRVMLAAYHRRRTAACTNSLHPPEEVRIKQLSEGLEDPAALDALRRLGFTTITLRRTRTGAAARERGLETYTRGPAPRLRVIHRDPNWVAWEFTER